MVSITQCIGLQTVSLASMSWVMHWKGAVSEANCDSFDVVYVSGSNDTSYYLRGEVGSEKFLEVS